MSGIAQRLRAMSFRAVVESFMGGFIFLLLIIIASQRASLSASSSSSRSKIARFGPSRTSFLFESSFRSCIGDPKLNARHPRGTQTGSEIRKCRRLWPRSCIRRL